MCELFVLMLNDENKSAAVNPPLPHELMIITNVSDEVLLCPGNGCGRILVRNIAAR